jgi:hypothetical protein
MISKRQGYAGGRERRFPALVIVRSVFVEEAIIGFFKYVKIWIALLRLR